MANSSRNSETLMLFDYGCFSYMAERLAKDFEKVYLYCPWEKSFPVVNDYIIGQGMEGVIKVQNVWDVFEEIDIWVFPDLHYGAFQKWLKNKGKKVFGACKGEEMEYDRTKMEEIMKSVGLDVPPGDNFTGMTALREHLKNNDNLFIKTNIFRGNHETWHHENYDLSKPILDELAHSLGANAEQEVFLAKKPIEDAIEYGYDGFCVNGKYPETTIFGIEIKDRGYVGCAMDYDDLPSLVKEINKKLSSIFKKYQYTGWYSNEIRAINDKKGYLIDQTTRMPEPPGGLAIEMIDNFSECVNDVANGEIPDLKFSYKYGVELIIKSSWAKDELQAIYYPDEIKDFVKIKNKCVIDGVTYFVPQGDGMTEIGAVVACSNDLEDAFLEVQYKAKQIKGYCIEIDFSCIDEMKKEIEKLKSKNIKNNF